MRHIGKPKPGNEQVEIPILFPLKQSLLEHGAKTIRKASPQLDQDITAALASQTRYEDLRAVLASHPEIRLRRWSKICRMVMEIDYAKWRTLNALLLLANQPDKKMQGVLGVSDGAWAYYHLVMWTVSVSGMLERTNALVSQMMRWWIEPGVSPKTSAIWHTLSSPIEQIKKRIDILRDPFVHGLEPRDSRHGIPHTEAFRLDGSYEEWALFDCWISPEGLSPGMLDFISERLGAIDRETAAIITVVDHTGRGLNNATPWSTLDLLR